LAHPASKLALLVTPGVHVSTADAYRALDRPLTGTPPSRIINSFQSLAWRIPEACPDQGWEAVNDFETVVFSQHPQLKSIKGKLLKLGARPALMSGSGSTVFGVFAERTTRDEAAMRLRQEFGNEKVHPVSLIGRSRYRSLWWRQLRNHMEGKAWPPKSRYAQ
jgi:4-diphosphocytidyl-2-C-methyl-D-erythritol kinase